jgi:hypothetical protein
MSPPAVHDTIALVLQAGKAGGMRPSRLADHLGISRRTMTRWIAHRNAYVSPTKWAALARLAYANDPALAATLAGRAGSTIEALGITPPPPPPPSVTPADLANLVVHAAAEAANLPPQAVRPIIATALEKAAALGLSVDAMREAMTGVKGKGRTGRAGA